MCPVMLGEWEPLTAQVNQRYDQSLDDVRRKVALDLEHMHRRSTTEDLRIMVLTVPVMIRAKGAL